MTQEYKENIIDYITGNMLIQSGTTSLDLTNDDYQNNLRTELQDYFNSVVVISQFFNNKITGYSVVVAYGQRKDTGASGGVLAILDKEYNIVQVLTKYSDNTNIGFIWAINNDENGVFIAEKDANNHIKIISTNDFTLKLDSQSQYSITKKDTLTVPNTYTFEHVGKIYRSDNKYFLFGQGKVNNGSTYYMGIEYTGSSWNYYLTSHYVETMQNEGFNVYWDNDGNLQFKIGVCDNDGFTLLTKGNSNNMAETNYLKVDTSIYTYVDGNSVIVSNQLGYASFTLDNQYIVVYKINFQTKEVNQIYTYNCDYSNTYNKLVLFKNNLNIFFYKTVSQEAEVEGVPNNYDLSFGVIDNTTCYEENINTYTAQANFVFAWCYANAINQFNKNYVYIQNQDTVYKIVFNWNQNNYNGAPFINTESLIPGSIGINNSSNIEIFNRNIYNLTNFSNYYTASILIPNNYITDLYKSTLYSKNNNIMVTKTLNLTTNKYEQVYVNFINQINITSNNLVNINGSSRLVNSMLNDDYVNTYIGKYRINYNDDTTSIKTIDNKNLEVISSTNYKYNIVIYTDKKINSVDLISNDEQTIYNTINCSNLGLNKYYKISQNLKIE